MDVKATQLNKTVVTASLTEAEFNLTIAQAVAKAAHVNLNAKEVTYRVLFDRRDTSTGIQTTARVEITIDHLDQDTPA